MSTESETPHNPPEVNADLETLRNMPSYRRLGKVKRAILEMLWPMELIHGRAVFGVVNQTEYDRRIRELRESGWQIKTVKGSYQLTSRDKLPGFVRTYPSPKLKADIRADCHNTCQLCGRDDNLQYDHKIPVERLGLTTRENMQLLCRMCNAEKRGVCRSCEMTSCDGCPYAYPELSRTRLAVILEDEIKEKLGIEAQQRGLSPSNVAAEIIIKYYQVT